MTFSGFSTVLTLLENRTFVPRLIFYLYWIFLPSVQMKTFVPVGSIAWYKCSLTGARQDLLLVTRYKYAHLYGGKRNPDALQR
jgi:hypothetical protein